jgi:hypothetical protein
MDKMTKFRIGMEMVRTSAAIAALTINCYILLTVVHK